MRRDIINTAILWFVLTFLAELLLPNFPFPIQAAQEAVFSDESFRVLLVLGMPVFTFVVAVLAYSLWKFRARGDTLEEGAPIRGNSWVSGVWLAVTGGLCVLVIVHPGLTGLAKFAGNPQAQLVVKVTGKQWAWDVEYPAQGIVHASELVLPEGQRVEFQVTSSDVLHSFWIPAFRNKIDAVPGTVTRMYVTPNKIGSFEQDYNLRVQCAEICGAGHAIMSMPVRIVSAQDFQTWVQTQAPPTDPVKRGELLAKSQGCTACHSTDGSPGVGPTWKGLFGEQETLADGTVVTVDEAYVRESIGNPSAKIVKGYNDGLMPKNFGTTLKEGQINDLLAYIASLK
ncbi:MAG: cytochrome c oxidase subunit II [Chloroflexi bacterium]|nr:cytochrome c oxidase subunit II [Chloroflexota bacterium]